MGSLSYGTSDPTLRDYVRTIWRRKWLVFAVAATLTTLAFAYSFTRTPLYAASAKLIYETQLNVADPLSSDGTDASQRQMELFNVASVVASPELAADARAIIGDGAMGSYTVEAVPDDASGQGLSSTVTITAVSGSPDTAARAANAYATAFVAYRKAREENRVSLAEEIIQDRLDAFDTPESRRTIEYLGLQERLQELQILKATVTGDFRVLVPASTPSAPYSPQPIRNGLMGLVAGLVFGAVLALAVAQFDTRVHGPDEAAALLDMPVLGQLRTIPSKKLDLEPIFVLGQANSAAAEAIRKIRGGLEFANVDGELKSLFITSASQHEGKSVTLCNLAVALAEAGIRVILVDGDLRRPQVHKYFDLPNIVGMSAVVTGRSNLRDAVHLRSFGGKFSDLNSGGDSTVSWNDRGSLGILTSGPVPPNPAEVIASRSFATLVEQLKAEWDLVLIDAPALLAVGDTSAIARCVDGIVFLANLTRAKRPLLREAAAQIAQMPCRKLGLVVIVKSSAAPGYRQYQYTPAVQDQASIVPLPLRDAAQKQHSD